MKAQIFETPKERKFVTCGEAQELSKSPSARIFWRPGSVVNWLKPDMDLAEVLED